MLPQNPTSKHISFFFASSICSMCRTFESLSPHGIRSRYPFSAEMLDLKDPLIADRPHGCGPASPAFSRSPNSNVAKPNNRSRSLERPFPDPKVPVRCFTWLLVRQWKAGILKTRRRNRHHCRAIIRHRHLQLGFGYCERIM